MSNANPMSDRLSSQQNLRSTDHVDLHKAHAADIALMFEDMPRPEVVDHLQEFDLRRRAVIFSYLPLDMQADLSRRLSPHDLTEIVNEMQSDDRADLFNHLEPDEQQQLIGTMDQEDREDLRRLAAHNPGTAGGLMSTEYATLFPMMSVKDAIAALRSKAPEKETIYRSYVIDDDHRLIGSLRLHELILAGEDTLIRDIMDSAPISVQIDTDQEDVAKMIARYDILAIPVLDGDGRLVGIVTHDDAADALQAETTEDFQKISTVMPFSQSLREAGIRVLYSRRIVWLALLVFGNLFSGAGIAYFEDMILAYVSLVFFMPLLIDSSGNAGSQSATLMVRALATGDVELKDWRDLILRELFVAMALGATMAALVYPVGALRGGTDIALVVGVTMFFVVIIGSLVGMSLPFLLSRLRMDPATASGPLVTTISDGVGVIIYFSIATLILGL